MDALVDAFCGFEELPRQHPDEGDEFRVLIHRCQDMLATRLARRTHPDGWPTHQVG